MNKTELVAAIAAKTELSKKDAEKVLSAVLETVAETLAAGKKVQLVGFGQRARGPHRQEPPHRRDRLRPRHPGSRLQSRPGSEEQACQVNNAAPVAAPPGAAAFVFI